MALLEKILGAFTKEQLASFCHGNEIGASETSPRKFLHVLMPPLIKIALLLVVRQRGVSFDRKVLLVERRRLLSHSLGGAWVRDDGFEGGIAR